MTSESIDPQFSERTISDERAQAIREEQLLKRAVVRLNGHVLGFVLGTIGALALFVATMWLVIKGGEVVGPHLGLLDNFLPGYSVSYRGGLVGAAYAFVIGYASGYLISSIYNFFALLRSNSHRPKTR
ncbi:MAG TPA: hypothetical protein PKC65_12870 [Pyrinomonadaceae bacterium]|nr:hypothetical protein [Pyrinomonadaceae bacterium]